MIITLLYFALALLLLVTIHEFGHFIVARMAGVKVLRFSFGFGPVLFRRYDRRGTEYAFSLLPLGGYVKMLDETEGEVALDEKPYAFNNQPVLKRIAIVIAGPLFNLLFAVFAFWLVLVIGITSIAPIIERTIPGSLADKAHFLPQEEIIAVDHKPVSSWRDVQYALMPWLGSDKNLAIGVVSSEAKSDKKLRYLPLSQWTPPNGKKGDLLTSLGIVPFIPKISPILGGVIQDSPAAKAGLQVDDKIKRLNQQSIDNWLTVVDYIKNNPGKTAVLEIERKEKILTLPIQIEAQRINGQSIGYLGIRSQAIQWPAGWVRVERQAPLTALKTAALQTFDLTAATFSLIGKLITRKVGMDNLSGPIGIAQGAGESGRSGLTYYLSFLALISISLGVLNLLPIPLLDGGHLVYYLVELIFRKPFPEKAKMMGMYLGFTLLMLLMLFSVVNDLTR